MKPPFASPHPVLLPEGEETHRHAGTNSAEQLSRP